MSGRAVRSQGQIGSGGVRNGGASPGTWPACSWGWAVWLVEGRARAAPAATGPRLQARVTVSRRTLKEVRERRHIHLRWSRWRPCPRGRFPIQWKMSGADLGEAPAGRLPRPLCSSPICTDVGPLRGGRRLTQLHGPARVEPVDLPGVDIAGSYHRRVEAVHVARAAAERGADGGAGKTSRHPWDRAGRRAPSETCHRPPTHAHAPLERAWIGDVQAPRAERTAVERCKLLGQTLLGPVRAAAGLPAWAVGLISPGSAACAADAHSGTPTSQQPRRIVHAWRTDNRALDPGKPSGSVTKAA